MIMLRCKLHRFPLLVFPSQKESYCMQNWIHTLKICTKAKEHLETRLFWMEAGANRTSFCSLNGMLQSKLTGHQKKNTSALKIHITAMYL